MSAITTHILNTSSGSPAIGVTVTLEQQVRDVLWQRIGEGQTDDDGRCRTLLPDDFPLTSGLYRLTFATGSYFQALFTPTFYPEVKIAFFVDDPAAHYHVPLLLSPFGYSTYRGS